MKRRLLHKYLLVLTLLGPRIAYAETVQVATQQTPSVRLINNLAINVSRSTGWFLTANQATTALDLEFDWTAATFVSMTCQTCRVVTAGVCQDTVAKDVDVIVSTSAAGVSTTVQSTWTRAVSADRGWGWMVANAYAPWTNCTFLGTGAGANDKLSVWQRNISP